jgi:hypothetical protein
VERFQRDHRLAGLPLYVQGYSSGGTMLLKLPEYLRSENSGLRIDGIVSVDAAPRGGFNAEDDSGRLKAGLAYPPTLFVVMQVGRGAEGGRVLGGGRRTGKRGVHRFPVACCTIRSPSPRHPPACSWVARGSAPPTRSPSCARTRSLPT